MAHGKEDEALKEEYEDPKEVDQVIKADHQEASLFERGWKRGWKGDAPLQERYGESGPSGKGGKVKSRKQAIAIGLSKARSKGQKIPKKKSS